jgi:hypothetical protein
MAILILVIFVPVAVGLAVSRSVPPLVAWIVPTGLGIFWFAAWRHEAAATGGGDNQAGLVALFGIVSVAIALLAVFVGFVIRRYRTP